MYLFTAAKFTFRTNNKDAFLKPQLHSPHIVPQQNDLVRKITIILIKQ